MTQTDPINKYKAYTEDCLRLSVSSFTKKKINQYPGGIFSLTWLTPFSWKEDIFKITVGVDIDFALIKFPDGRSQVIEHGYLPGYTGPHKAFICPKCQKQRYVLWLPGPKDIFLCRRCHELGYWQWRQPGQTRSPTKNMEAKLRYILRKVGKL